MSPTEFVWHCKFISMYCDIFTHSRSSYFRACSNIFHREVIIIIYGRYSTLLLNLLTQNLWLGFWIQIISFPFLWWRRILTILSYFNSLASIIFFITALSNGTLFLMLVKKTNKKVSAVRRVIPFNVLIHNFSSWLLNCYAYLAPWLFRQQRWLISYPYYRMCYYKPKLLRKANRVSW